MKKRIVEYHGREYQVALGGCRDCPDAPCGHRIGRRLRETLRSRLSHWWRGWVKRNIIDEGPMGDSRDATHVETPSSTLQEVNARRGFDDAPAERKPE